MTNKATYQASKLQECMQLRNQAYATKKARKKPAKCSALMREERKK